MGLRANNCSRSIENRSRAINRIIAQIGISALKYLSAQAKTAFKCCRTTRATNIPPAGYAFATTINSLRERGMAGDYDTVPLGEVASVRSGFAFKSSDWTESGIPVVKIANVKDGSLVMEACSFVPYSVAALASEFALQAGDILIAMTGYIGDVALVRERNLPAVLNQRVGRFTVRNPRRLDQRFLFYFLRDADVPKEIEVNRRMSEKLEGIARALFESWFVRFDPVRRNMARKGHGQPSPGLRPPSPSGKGVGVRVWPKALLSIKSTRSSLPRHDSVTSVSPPSTKVSGRRKSPGKR